MTSGHSATALQFRTPRVLGWLQYQLNPKTLSQEYGRPDHVSKHRGGDNDQSSAIRGEAVSPERTQRYFG